MAEPALKTSEEALTDTSEIGEIWDRVQTLARNISYNISCILRALQIGDLSRQRAEHVQSGLALLDGLTESAWRPKVRAAGEILLAAQLEAALLDHGHEVSQLIPSIEGLAIEALSLVALGNVVSELSAADPDYRGLKRRMQSAVQLVAEVQAAKGAANYLAGRLANADGAVVSNGCSKAKSGRHPLDHRAAELLGRSAYLEAAADDCVVIMERLKDASDALVADPPIPVQNADHGLEWGKGAAAAATIQAIRVKAQTDIAVHAEKTNDMFGLLDGAAGQCAALPEMTMLDPQLKAEVSGLFSRIEALYVMRQERDVHRKICKAFGLDAAEEPESTEYDLF